jgi:hypothetical protein
LIGVLVIVLIGLGVAAAILIAQSRTPPQKQAAAATSTPTSSISPTPTPAPSATATPTPAATCGTQASAPLTIQQLGIIDFVPKKLLPDTLALKPLPVDQAQGPGNITFGNSIGMRVSFPVPSAPHIGIICQVSVRIVAFQALAGSVTNVWGSCDEYDNPGGLLPGGCGGGAPGDGAAALTFPCAQVGTTLTAPVASASNDQPPTQISSTSQGTIVVAIQVSIPGTYTFQVGLWQNASGPKWSNVTLRQMILLNHIAHLWSGEACTAPDMQSQLPPPANPPTAFICPGGPPQQ